MSISQSDLACFVSLIVFVVFLDIIAGSADNISKTISDWKAWTNSHIAATSGYQYGCEP